MNYSATTKQNVKHKSKNIIIFEFELKLPIFKVILRKIYTSHKRKYSSLASFW